MKRFDDRIVFVHSIVMSDFVRWTAAGFEDQTAGEKICRCSIRHTCCALLQSWIDERIRWDPNDYNQLRIFRMPASKLWLPDIVLYNRWVDKLALYGGAVSATSQEACPRICLSLPLPLTSPSSERPQLHGIYQTYGEINMRSSTPRRRITAGKLLQLFYGGTFPGHLRVGLLAGGGGFCIWSETKIKLSFQDFEFFQIKTWFTSIF